MQTVRRSHKMRRENSVNRITVVRVVTVLVSAVLSSSLSGPLRAQEPPTNATPEFYRSLTLKVRKNAHFRVPMPSNGDLKFQYGLTWGAGILKLPLVRDFTFEPGSSQFFRNFWDKVSLEDGSFLEVGGEQVPLTCIYLEGRDNRFSKTSPLIPDFLLKIYLVANDFTCTGPINPGWPANGGKRETWDTYVYFEVRDPTVMLPIEAKIRYRWSEFSALVIDEDGYRVPDQLTDQREGVQ